ncbi:hypothetical protein BXY66_3862 [Shimia isoporae]|uniref:Phage portal protein n=1 Tax=Shimia isoporae TaxID=647720 RepID=A0A4V2Q1W1_9RHOB|nr:hypothetical protein [Shimia isoporae]TCK99360.1 hypothetical protein BXY66_3862 [Shimia isoporae]
MAKPPRIDTPLVPPAGPLRRQAGTSGLRHVSGYLQEEYQRELQGRRGRELYNEMETASPVIGGMLFAIRSAMRGANWRVIPADDSDAADRLKVLIEEGLADMQQSMSDVVSSAASMLTYGFSIQEPLWRQRKGKNRAQPWLSSKYNDGLWFPYRLAARSQRTIDRWIFDQESEQILGFVQTPWNGIQRSVPMSRCLHYRTTDDLDNPEGRSILRNAYVPYYFTKRLNELEAIGCERDLTGYPVLKVPGELLSNDADPSAIATRNAYESMLGNIRRDTMEGLLLPSDVDDAGNAFYQFELMTSGGTRAVDTDAMIRRHEVRMAQSVMADFLFIGSESTGSHALAEVKLKSLLGATENLMQSVAHVLNTSLLPMLSAINGFDDDLMPTLQPEPLVPADLDGLGNYITSLTNAGIPLTDQETENTLRELADLPEGPAPEDRDAALMMPPMDLGDDTADDTNVVPFTPPADDPSADDSVQMEKRQTFGEAMGDLLGKERF